MLLFRLSLFSNSVILFSNSVIWWVSLVSSYLELSLLPRSGYLFFPQFRKVFSRLFLPMGFCPFLSLFSFETLICESYSVYFQIGSLKQSSLYFFIFIMFFLFAALFGWFQLPCLPNHLFFVSSSGLLLNSSSGFFNLVIAFFRSLTSVVHSYIFYAFDKFVSEITYSFPKFNPFYDHKF